MRERGAAHKRVLIGVELEAYSIGAWDSRIGRKLVRPRGAAEKGERFTRDASIGSEYNSRPFETVRESLFLLKSGLRKYLRRFYRTQTPDADYSVPLLVGGWTNRFAGMHLHLSIAGERLSLSRARSLARHLHAHMPFFIAVGANSPVWGGTLTGRASMRLLRGHRLYFKPVERGRVRSKWDEEMVYSPGRKTKPPTLELRAFDSNVPEYASTVLSLVKAVALRWLRRGAATNLVSQEHYLAGRVDAGFRGLHGRLRWRKDWLDFPHYLDRFLWEHRAEFELMDLPEEVFEVYKLLKKGWNGARLIHDAAALAKDEHPQTWQQRFAKRYHRGLELLLSGNSLRDFAAALKVPLPPTARVELGRRGASIHGR